MTSSKKEITEENMLSLNGLTYRNVKENIAREPVYFFTMILIEMLMLAFNSMLFSKDVQEICQEGFIMDVLIGFVTIFIIAVMVWLIYYMMRQSFKYRSKEISLYMLFGLKQKEIYRNYAKETMLMATLAFAIGAAAGEVLKHFVMAIFYRMFRLDYVIEMNFYYQAIILTALIYFFCYIAALAKIRKKFLKLTINELSQLERTNEKNKASKAIKTRKWLLSGNRLFIWRSVESEIKSIKKIIFFVSFLLMISIVGSSVAMMYTDYENNQIDAEYPYDVMVYHENPDLNFNKEKEILDSSSGIKQSLEYNIYQNQSSYMNNWLYCNLNFFGDRLKDKNGEFDESKLEKEDDYDVYYTYDTYMKLSDYNALLKMLGKKQISLKKDEYVLQIKQRLEPELSDTIRNREITCGNEKLHCKNISTVDFEQNGHNGADYVFVITDEAAQNMTPYYSVLTAMTREPVTEDITDRFDDDSGNFRYGSNHSILYTSPVLAKKEVEISLKSTVTAVLFPFAYVSLIFLCVAISLLAAHLMSTTKTNKKRYDLLRKMGMTKKEIDMIIHRQLAINYMIPLVMSLIPGWILSIKMSTQFILDTGLHTSYVRYILLSLLWILTVYIVYFIMTDVFFRRNIHYGRER